MFWGYALVVLAALLWSLIGPLTKFAIQGGMSPTEVAFWRASLAWLAYVPQGLAGRSLRVAPGDLPWLLLFGLVCVAGLFGSYGWAVRTGGAALASVLLYTAPAWVALLAWKFLAEAMTPVKLAAVALTIAGVACVSLGHGLDGQLGLAAVGLGLLSGFIYSLYYIFGKFFLRRLSTPAIFSYALPVGALAMLPFTDFGHRSAEAWLACAVLALFSTYGAYTLYYAGLRRIEATRAAVTATLEPVSASLLAFGLFGESFTPLGYFGAGLVLIAVLLTVLKGSR
jgi:DME family drug/metabolite transporter